MSRFEDYFKAVVSARAAPSHRGPMRSVHHIRCIVVHATAGTQSLDWLRFSSAPPVSAHRLVAKDGTIYDIVPDIYVAFHAGFSDFGIWSNGNDQTLGIEVENLNNGRDPYPDAQIRATAACVAYWMHLYGDLPVVPHWLIDSDGNKSDPQRFPWLSFWRYVVAVRDILNRPARSAPA